MMVIVIFMMKREDYRMEFLMILLVFPILSLLFGMIGQLFIRRVYLVVGIVILSWLIVALTLFNETFFEWVFLYSLLSLLGAGFVRVIQKKK